MPRTITTLNKAINFPPPAPNNILKAIFPVASDVGHFLEEENVKPGIMQPRFAQVWIGFFF